MILEHLNGRATRPASILIVDDTSANLRILAGMLKERGYRVRVVPSGRQALLEAETDPPDLVLLDINMPEMSGYEVCEHLKADDRLMGIPVIFISALTEQLDKVKAFDMGGVDYLTKPFHLQELHARVATHLKLRRMQLELEEHSRRLELARERLELDLKLARRVQRGFLPSRLPVAPGYDFYAHYESAHEVGGDYYDFISLPGERVAVLVGDVAGKGVAAALLMAKLSADARFCMLTEPNPGTAFNRLNTLMQESGVGDQFVTVVAAVLEPARHTVTLVNAGHPPPLIYHRSTRTVEQACHERSGFPLGVEADAEYASCEIPLEPGDSMVVFTDGVSEALDLQDSQLRTNGICAALQGEASSPPGLVKQVLHAVTEFTSGRSQHDDIALVAFGRTG